MKKNQKIFVVLAVAIVFIFFGFNFVKKVKEKRIELAKQEEVRKNKAFEGDKKKIVEALDKAGILASAISVYDMTVNKKIYSKNDTKRLPLASLTKIMTTIIAMEDIHRNLVFVSKNALKEFGEYDLKENEAWVKNDLIKFSLITSSNDATFALAEGNDIFLEKMNEKAKDLGMSETFFKNVTGLDISKNEGGAYGSAEDVNKLSIYGLKTYPDIFKTTTSSEMTFESVTGFKHVAKNTNLSLDKIPNILFSKTGLTETAGGNLTVIFETNNKHKIAVTILGSTTSGRFSDIEKITNIIYDKYTYE